MAIHAIEIAVDLIVPEPQYAEAIASEAAITGSVSFGVGFKIMLASIHLDNETMLHTYEIHDVASTRRLAPKMESASTP